MYGITSNGASVNKKDAAVWYDLEDKSMVVILCVMDIIFVYRLCLWHK